MKVKHKPLSYKTNLITTAIKPCMRRWRRAVRSSWDIEGERATIPPCRCSLQHIWWTRADFSLASRHRALKIFYIPGTHVARGELGPFCSSPEGGENLWALHNVTLILGSQGFVSLAFTLSFFLLFRHLLFPVLLVYLLYCYFRFFICLFFSRQDNMFFK